MRARLYGAQSLMRYGTHPSRMTGQVLLLVFDNQGNAPPTKLLILFKDTVKRLQH